MKSTLSILLVSLAAMSPVFAKEKAPAPVKETPSTISFGPTFFGFHGVEKDADCSTEQKGVYSGARGELAYTKVDGIHGGILGVYAPGAQTAYHTQTSAGGKSGMKASTYLWQLEGKLGKHMPVNAATNVIPFVGVGTYHVGSTINTKSRSSEKEVVSSQMMDWGYFVVGAVGSYTMHQQLDLGVGVKVLRHFFSFEKDVFAGMETEKKLHARWGYELSAPVKFYADRKIPWVISAEPFMLKIDVSRNINVYGARLNVHHSF